MLDYFQARTFHARRGALKHSFAYGVDFVLTDFSDFRPRMISRNRFNLWSLFDRDHGGPRGSGRGVEWFREELEKRGFPVQDAELLLLTQPRHLWFHFNPVSFWIAQIDGKVCAFVAEVNSTFGQRHCYFCAHHDYRPIAWKDCLEAEKMMHVSPFQKIAGDYRFNFELSETNVRIRIAYENDDQGVLATLEGKRRPATDASLLFASVRRPMGAARVLALIHWQAALLYLKKAPFLKKQPPATQFTTESRNLIEAQE